MELRTFDALTFKIKKKLFYSSCLRILVKKMSIYSGAVRIFKQRMKGFIIQVKKISS